MKRCNETTNYSPTKIEINCRHPHTKTPVKKTSEKPNPPTSMNFNHSPTKHIIEKIHKQTTPINTENEPKINREESNKLIYKYLHANEPKINGEKSNKLIYEYLHAIPKLH